MGTEISGTSDYFENKAFLFGTPINSTVYSKNELAELVKVFEKYSNIIIISDEIYEHINFMGEHIILGTDSIKDRVVTVNGVSKGFAMTGWRVGYLGAPNG